MTAGLAAVAAVAAGGGLTLNDQRVARARANGRIAGPRQEGLTSTQLIWKADTEEPVVALTFDDGPDPRYTPGVLEALDSAGVPATFFMQGSSVLRHAELAQGVAERHVVGNHTYSHTSLATASADLACREMEEGHEAILAVTGVEPDLFRPPYGHLSGAAGLQAAQLGYDVILWSQRIDSRASPASNVDRLAGKVGAGDVVLGHDGGRLPNHTVVEALPDLVAVVADQGFQFVTVPDLLEA